MNEKDELDRIMEDLDSKICEDANHVPEEASDPDLEKDNSTESQSDRLERLHQEGELTSEEFRLLQTELIGGSSSSDGLSSVDVPSVKVDNQFLTLEVLGYEHINNLDHDTEGIIAAVEIKSKKEDLTIKPSYFTLHSSDGYTYSAVDLKDEHISDSADQEFTRKLVNSLPNKWPEPIPAGWYEVSAGGRIKGILYFPCDSDTAVSKIRYKADMLRHLLDIPDKKIKSSFGVPKHANNSRDSDIGAWDEYSFDITLSDTQQKYYSSLPNKVKSELKN